MYLLFRYHNMKPSEIPKNRVPPIPLEKELTLFNQLLGFFISSATLKSHSVASAMSCSIIKSLL